MKNDFTHWKNDYGLEFEPNYSKETESDCRAAFKAGQQSKQAEVDELRKRIDEAMKYVSESPLKDVSRRAMINFMDILKGDSYES